MIKVLHYGISSHLGGIETYSYKLARNFDLTEYHFDFLYLGSKKPCFYDEMSALGCGFIGITSRRENYLNYKKELDDVFRDGDWDIVHLHINELINIDPVYAALKYHHKVIVHSRNGGSPDGFIRNLVNRINYYRLRRVNVCRVAVSDYAGYWMFGKDAQFQVINNGVELAGRGFSAEDRKKIRKELGINDEILLVHTGSFKRQKNHGFLIDVFNEICKRNNHYRLALVGTGELMDEIKNKVVSYGLDDKVMFLGQRDDVSKVLSAGDIFVFPSLYEGYPNALIEAEASGLPCIISDTITDNVVVSGCTVKLSIREGATIWSEKILKTNKSNDRTNGILKISECGMDVTTEVNALMKLYEDTLKMVLGD